MNKRLFAIGDIHGCFNAVRSLLEQKIQIKESNKIILLGDYIDRGTRSKEFIHYLLDLKAKGIDIVPSRGIMKQCYLMLIRMKNLILNGFRG